MTEQLNDIESKRLELLANLPFQRMTLLTLGGSNRAEQIAAERQATSSSRITKVSQYLHNRALQMGVTSVSITTDDTWSQDLRQNVQFANGFTEHGETLWPLVAHAQITAGLCNMQSGIFIAPQEPAKFGYSSGIRPYMDVTGDGEAVPAAMTLCLLDSALEDALMRQAAKENLTYEQWLNKPDDERVLDLSDVANQVDHTLRLFDIDPQTGKLVFKPQADSTLR